jgi:tubulin-folding cofactor B
MQMTIESVKIKLSFHCGSNPSAMVLQLLDESGNLQATLYEDSKKLGYYSPHNG